MSTYFLLVVTVARFHFFRRHSLGLVEQSECDCVAVRRLSLTLSLKKR